VLDYECSGSWTSRTGLGLVPLAVVLAVSLLLQQPLQAAVYKSKVPDYVCVAT
jgi:hypothetical protein